MFFTWQYKSCNGVSIHMRHRCSEWRHCVVVCRLDADAASYWFVATHRPRVAGRRGRVFVGVFVCLSASISPGLNVRSSPNFMCMLGLPIRQSSPGDVAICYVLSILRMTSYVHRPNWGMSIVLQSAVIEWRNSSSSCASWHPYCVVLVASCPIKTVGTETRRVHRAGGVSGAQPAMHQCLV